MALFYGQNINCKYITVMLYYIDVCVLKGAVSPRFSVTIVTQGTGYETLQVSKAITKVLQFMLKVLRQCTIFCLTFAHYGSE